MSTCPRDVFVPRMPCITAPPLEATFAAFLTCDPFKRNNAHLICLVSELYVEANGAGILQEMQRLEKNQKMEKGFSMLSIFSWRVPTAFGVPKNTSADNMVKRRACLETWVFGVVVLGQLFFQQEHVALGVLAKKTQTVKTTRVMQHVLKR